MLVVGLTGSIGMGKTTVANFMAERGVPVLDSDAVVHRLYEGRAVPEIEAAFPGSTREGKVDRPRLAETLVATPEGFGKLEAIVHPLVRQMQWEFLCRNAPRGADLCVLDIPLLFETGADELLDVTVVVSAPEAVQKARVLERPGMTEGKLNAILARQMPDAEKRARSDHVINTGLALDETRREVDRLLESLRNREGTVMELWRQRYGDAAGHVS